MVSDSSSPEILQTRTARPPVAPVPPEDEKPNEASRLDMMPGILSAIAGNDLERRIAVKTHVIRVLIILNIILGTRYLIWRAAFSVNWDLWLFGISLLVAEMFSYTDSLMFGLNMWRIRHRPPPEMAQPGLTVDVFVTTYNEPMEIVEETVRAAREMPYPHLTWVLDDGDRPEMRAMSQRLGVGYLVRDVEWEGKDRHAKAGNLINAMDHTNGEFMLILDADQVPRPQLLDHVLGYFRDPKVGFVQTPQWFKNTPPGDPFGTDAPLFYGPIQAGKDGWNSAFFCGSNAVLRREALMQLGVVWYAKELDNRVRTALDVAVPALKQARKDLQSAADPRIVVAVDQVIDHVKAARVALRKGEPLQAVTWNFQRAVQEISQRIVDEDLNRIHEELKVVPGVVDPKATPVAVARRMSLRTLSPLRAIEPIRELLLAIDMDRAEAAKAVQPMSTVSVTEDMATAMRLHSLGWASIYHHEVLAVGLAPDDLASALQQRLRWAQGTLQVMLRENPLTQQGLSLAQRLLYFGTMWSYLSGFATVVYLISPVLYLVFGLMPVRAFSAQFFTYLVPWLIVNQTLFLMVGWGHKTFRGQQYSLALFPLWIRAVWTTIANVYFGRKLGFVVTPKTRQEGVHLGLVWPQLLMMALLVVAIAVGLVGLGRGWTLERGPVLINIFWAGYNLAMLSVVVPAATYQPTPDTSAATSAAGR